MLPRTNFRPLPLFPSPTPPQLGTTCIYQRAAPDTRSPLSKASAFSSLTSINWQLVFCINFAYTNSSRSPSAIPLRLISLRQEARRDTLTLAASGRNPSLPEILVAIISHSYFSGASVHYRRQLSQLDRLDRFRWQHSLSRSLRRQRLLIELRIQNAQSLIIGAE